MNFFQNIPDDIIYLISKKYLTEKEKFYFEWALNFSTFREITEKDAFDIFKLAW